MEVYPLKFFPILKERLWGGRKLQTVLNKPEGGTNVGESWELSGVPGDISVIENGVYQGKSLTELIELFPKELLGGEVYGRFGREFPILIKFIDAQKDLSIYKKPGSSAAY